MKIPKKIKVGGHIYKVILRNRNENDGASELGTANIYNKLKIWLDTGQASSQLESTLLHEIIEIVNALNKIGLTEEKICQLETGLYQVFSDNKLLK